jgi:hypothetical protein
MMQAATKVQIGPGDNTLRVAGVKRGRTGIYDVYQFTLVNLTGTVTGFCFKIPAGTLVTGIVRDLDLLRKEKLWFTAYLKETNKMLAIVTIKEPRMAQQECWSLAGKLTPSIVTPWDGSRN